MVHYGLLDKRAIGSFERKHLGECRGRDAGQRGLRQKGRRLHNNSVLGDATSFDVKE